jgi:hypothetical protein
VEAEVVELSESKVTLQTSDGEVFEYGWRGSDPAEVLSVHQRVTMSNEEHVCHSISVEGEVLLCALETHGEMFFWQDISSVGVSIADGEVCTTPAYNHDCEAETEHHYHSALLTDLSSGEEGHASIGETVEIGNWVFSLIDAYEEPGVWTYGCASEPYESTQYTLMRR